MAVVVDYMRKLIHKIRSCLPDNGTASRIFTWRANDHERITGNKARALIAMMILVLVATIVLGYLFIASATFSRHHPKIDSIDVQYMHIHMNIVRGILDMDGAVSLRVVFTDTTTIQAYPDLGTFIPHDKRDGNDNFVITSESKYLISNVQQYIVVKFRQLKTLPEKQLVNLNTTLASGRFWMRLDGNFRMNVKLSRFMPFPHCHKHAFFSCSVLYMTFCWTK